MPTPLEIRSVGQETAPTVNELELRRICVRYGIATLRIFGSAARGDASPTSDVDMLYELQPGRKLGWEIEDLNQELTKLFGRPVDSVSKKSLHPLLRETVLRESKALYAA